MPYRKRAACAARAGWPGWRRLPSWGLVSASCRRRQQRDSRSVPRARWPSSPASPPFARGSWRRRSWFRDRKGLRRPRVVQLPRPARRRLPRWSPTRRLRRNRPHRSPSKRRSDRERRPSCPSAPPLRARLRKSGQRFPMIRRPHPLRPTRQRRPRAPIRRCRPKWPCCSKHDDKPTRIQFQRSPHSSGTLARSLEVRWRWSVTFSSSRLWHARGGDPRRCGARGRSSRGLRARSTPRD